MGVWAGSLINLLSSIGPNRAKKGHFGPNRALMRRMRSKMRRMRSKMRKMRSKMRKMRRKMRKCEAKCENAKQNAKNAKTHEQNANSMRRRMSKMRGNPNLCKQNSIVATLFRSKIICTVRMRIGSFVMSHNHCHQSSNTYIDTDLLLYIYI